MKIQIIIDQPTSGFLALLASLPLDGTIEVHPVTDKKPDLSKKSTPRPKDNVPEPAPIEPEPKPVAKPSITFESVRTWITDRTKGETEADEVLRVKIKAALTKYIPEEEKKKTLSKLPTEHLEAFYHDITH